MPSKLKKAIDAVKDQTSISLAKVGGNNASNLEVAILKATSHDEVPMDERYVNEILQLIASNKVYAATCAQAISKRIGKTRNWIVALKSLMLVLKIFQDGDPYFPREVLHTMKKGGRILNLSSFRDNSNSSPWDYTAYVRTYALYLDERLDCFLMGKLQRRVAFRNMKRDALLGRKTSEPIIRDMKPAMLLDRISYWQRLLDRAIATRPTGSAKNNSLVCISLYAIVQESFDLYRDISDGLTLLLDSFFHLQYQACALAFQTCIKASKQFEELSEYFSACRSLGVGRISEYPSVQKISNELIMTLQEFLKDQASFPSNGRVSSQQLFLPSTTNDKDPNSKSEYGSCENSDTNSEHAERLSEKGSEYGSQCASQDDMVSAMDGWGGAASPCVTVYQDAVEAFEKSPQHISVKTHSTCPSISSLTSEQTNQIIDFVSADDWPRIEQPPQQDSGLNPQDGSSQSWELELAVTAGLLETNPTAATGMELVPFSNDPFSDSQLPYNQNNPFLQDTPTFNALDIIPMPTTTDSQGFFSESDPFSSTPTFRATSTLTPSPTFKAIPTLTPSPTFSVHNMNQNVGSVQYEDDLFASDFGEVAADQTFGSSTDQRNLQYEQQLWLQNQSKIIAKHIS